MVCLLDQGEFGNIHPTAKRPVGERLAELAGQMIYGGGEVSPRALDKYTEGSRLVIRLSAPVTARNGSEPALLVTFGLSIILQDVLLLLFSADAQHAFAAYSLETVHFAGLDLSLLNMILFAISALCLAGITWFLSKSDTGRAIRAVSDDPHAAMLSGISVRRIYAVAMGLSMATAAVGGLCVGLKWTFHPSSGGDYLLISFIVVVIGGMGSVPGTFLAGLAFGLAQVYGGASYGMLISYIALLLILALRPGGLMGGKGGRFS